MSIIDTAFSTTGLLSQSIQGFMPRKEQLIMAKAVYSNLKKKQQLVIEAGTGTGKTFAYLVPVLLEQKKTMISTGSKNLQDQLFYRDLPLMIKTLNFTGRVALLKGRSNYLCLERLAKQLHESHHQSAPAELLHLLINIRTWSATSKDGDLANCDLLPEDSPHLHLVTSTHDNCLGKDCPQVQDCYVFKARQKAMQSDIIIVNHHLFFADLAIKDTGFGELIPDVEAFIFDEAHQLPDIATQYFGQSFSSRQLKGICRDILIGYRSEAFDMRQLEKVANQIESAFADGLQILQGSNKQGNWRDMLDNKLVVEHIERLNQAILFGIDVLKVALGRSQILDSAFERLNQAKMRLARVCDVSISGYSYWYEISPYHFSINMTPLSVEDKFQPYIQKLDASWLFTSATLAVQGEFSHFTHRLGLAPHQCLTLNSPFDYQKQALLCVPRRLPKLAMPDTAQKLAQLLAPVIEKNKGRCFFLCTSHQMMKQIAQYLREILTLPVLMQGEKNKQKLLQEFLEHGNAILVATGAFWEGVDVKGSALSCVIIDKIPFTSPEDPLLKARIEDCQIQGKEPFTEIQIPDAVIHLKQGIGRLIRGQDDQGVLIICDQRLVSREYGQIFLDSFPNIPRTRDINKVMDFLS